MCRRQHRGEDQRVHPPAPPGLRVDAAARAGRSRAGTPPPARRRRPGPWSIRTRNPHRSTANRCSVRYGTTTPRRASSSSIFTIDNGSCFRPSTSTPRTQPRICSSCAEQRLPRRAVPVRPGRTDRLHHQPDQLVGDRVRDRRPGSAPQPRPPRRTGGRSCGPPPPARATVRSPCPSSHARSTSRTSTTLTSLNPIPVDLHVDGHDAGSQRANPGPPGAGAPGGPMTGNPGGPMKLAENRSARSHAHGRRHMAPARSSVTAPPCCRVVTDAVRGMQCVMERTQGERRTSWPELQRKSWGSRGQW